MSAEYSPVVRHLAVAHAAHEAAIVEVLRTVVRVAKVLLEVLWRLVVTVGGVIQLHVSATLVGDTSTGLKIRIYEKLLIPGIIMVFKTTFLKSLI